MRRLRWVFAGWALAAVIPLARTEAQEHDIKEVPSTLPSTLRNHLENERLKLVDRQSALAAETEQHDSKCSSVRAGTADASSCAEAKKSLESRIADYLRAVDAFNASVDQAIESSSASVALREQDDLSRNPGKWLRTESELVRTAVGQDRERAQAVLAAIRELRSPTSEFATISMKQLEPGDILLLAPEDLLGTSIQKADYLVRAGTDFADGRVFRAARETIAPASHALTFVKEVGGRMLFLDHTSVGSRILDNNTFESKYGRRDTYIARPQAVVDGRELWSAARDAALRKKSDYGLFGSNTVCSERAGFVVAHATGLSLNGNRLGPVDVTPGDFFDKTGVGKYFVIFRATH